jgi:hypothetical protein
MAKRNANPAQTTAVFGAKKWFFGYAADAGNPFRYKDFPLVHALSLSRIEHFAKIRWTDQAWKVTSQICINVTLADTRRSGHFH